MKRIICLVCAVLVVLFAFSACADEKKEQNETEKEAIAVPDGNQDKKDNNPISGPISNSNYESAFTDATNAVTLFLSYQIEEGVAYIDNGTVFEVDKNGVKFAFLYENGELVYDEDPIYGADVTPTDETWLVNVKVYMP